VQEDDDGRDREAQVGGEKEQAAQEGDEAEHCLWKVGL
jgi:hypothetical protein